MEALLFIGLQNDFMPGGPLAIPNGLDSVHAANRSQKLFNIIVACKDWHPNNHLSFASMHPGKKPGDKLFIADLEQTLWPKHCVQNTQGAAFVKELEQNRIEFVAAKGEDPELDSYSAFFDNAHKHETALCSYLRRKQVDELYILGVATDYCVKYSALDALKLGFKTHVIIDACQGINLNPGDIDNAIAEMSLHGARLVTLSQLITERN